MNPALKTSDFPSDFSSAREKFLAVIVYEDEAAFMHAEPLCHRLFQEFHDAEFDSLWVSFAGLSVRQIAEDAAEKAIQADLVIFSAHAKSDLPDPVKEWIESWLPRKNLEESALAALIGLPADERKGVTAIHLYLREIAARGHMNYLPEISSERAGSEPLSEEHFLPQQRIDPEKILRRPMPPQHWGINE